MGGAWPIVSLRSFEWVYGKKRDIFLQKTVGGLLFSIGCVQLASAGSEEEIRVARRLGIATAATLLAIDLAYIPRGEMRWTYWQDALCEIGWIGAWLRTNDQSPVSMHSRSASQSPHAWKR
ncbi:MAG: hypothetical protein LC808_37585 [Actinobacteria bacterium]|nr:hypothetical protein [Actinomycetota bacterium]